LPERSRLSPNWHGEEFTGCGDMHHCIVSGIKDFTHGKKRSGGVSVQIPYASPVLWMRTQKYELFNLNRFLRIVVEDDGVVRALRGYLDATDYVTLYEVPVEDGWNPPEDIFDVVCLAISDPLISTRIADNPTPNPGFIDLPYTWAAEK